MAKVDLVVGIGAEYKGKPAFKKALTDTQKLTNSVKSLAKGYVGLLGAQKAFAYGQQSLKAFVEDDKAARQLAQTVSNLGLAYEATNVENFIQGLERTYAVADDLLRPAMAKLIQVTQSYTKSKEIMTTALNAAAGAGVDLGTAVQDLSQAYVGNLRGLRKYNLGLTQAELATKSFQEIQDLLNKTFTGQASLAAETYAGKMAALTIASNNAKEIIGEGLVNAISSAFGGGQIDKATSNIEKMAKVVADIVAGLGTMTGWFTKLVSLTDKLTVGNFLENRQPNTPYDPRSGNMPDMSPAATKIIMQRQKADREAAKRQKELASLAGKQTKAIKEQTALAKAKAVLDKSNAVFNLDLIQNTAALQGKLTDDETLRLKLQREILLGNSTAAADLAQELLSVQRAAIIAGNVDPFGRLSDSVLEALKSLQQLRNELELLGSKKVKTPAQILAEDYQDVLIDLADPTYDDFFKETKDFLDSIKNQPSGNMDFNYQDAFARPNAAAGFTPTELRIFIDPSAAAYGINAAVVGANANGTASTVNRNGVFSYGS
jgi:hypothetical protein